MMMSSAPGQARASSHGVQAPPPRSLRPWIKTPGMPASWPASRISTPSSRKRVVREVVRADAHERELRVVGTVAVRAGAPVAFLRDDRVLPGHPLGRGPRPDLESGSSIIRAYACEQPRDRRRAVGRQPIRIGQARKVAEPGPGLREEPPDAPVQPVDLQPPGRRHAEHEHPAHPLRMPLRVRQRQRHPPRPAAQQPPVHAQVLPQPLHVAEQVRGRVQAHVRRRVAGVRSAAIAVALVEEDDPELLGVERRAASRAEHPDPGPPCTIKAGTPSGFPHVSEYTRFPSPVSSIPVW